jgi:ATP synthase protein I
MTKNLPTPRRGPPPGMPALAVPLGALAACEPTLHRDDLQGVWLGLDLMGLVGWSVAVPTLLGAALGLWLDQQYPGARLWTVALMVVGLGLGCKNAWHWISREDVAMREGQHDSDD